MSRSLTGIYLEATSGHVPVADGTQWNSVAISGDIALDSTGLSTIQPGVVTNSKLASLAQGSIKIGDASNQVTDLPIGTAGQVFLSDGTTGAWTTLSGGVASISGSGVVTLNPVPLVFNNQTADYTITAPESGTIFTNEGASASVNFTLPTPSLGLNFEFWALADQQISITTGNTGTESIVTNDAGSTASGFQIAFNGSATSQFAVLKLIGRSSTSWIVDQNIGSWFLTL